VIWLTEVDRFLGKASVAQKSGEIVGCWGRISPNSRLGLLSRPYELDIAEMATDLQAARGRLKCR
jgi:hypothetical protein